MMVLHCRCLLLSSGCVARCTVGDCRMLEKPRSRITRSSLCRSLRFWTPAATLERRRLLAGCARRRELARTRPGGLGRLCERLHLSSVGHPLDYMSSSRAEMGCSSWSNTSHGATHLPPAELGQTGRRLFEKTPDHRTSTQIVYEYHSACLMFSMRPTLGAAAS